MPKRTATKRRRTPSVPRLRLPPRPRAVTYSGFSKEPLALKLFLSLIALGVAGGLTYAIYRLVQKYNRTESSDSSGSGGGSGGGGGGSGDGDGSGGGDTKVNLGLAIGISLCVLILVIAVAFAIITNTFGARTVLDTARYNTRRILTGDTPQNEVFSFKGGKGKALKFRVKTTASTGGPEGTVSTGPAFIDLKDFKVLEIHHAQNEETGVDDMYVKVPKVGGAEWHPVNDTLIKVNNVDTEVNVSDLLSISNPVVRQELRDKGFESNRANRREYQEGVREARADEVRIRAAAKEEGERQRAEAKARTQAERGDAWKWALDDMPVRIITLTEKEFSVAKKHCDAAGFKGATRFEGVLGKSVRGDLLEDRNRLSLRALHEIEHAKKREAHSSMPGWGGVGCYLSHVALWQEALRSPAGIFVFEADAVPPKATFEKVKGLLVRARAEKREVDQLVFGHFGALKHEASGVPGLREAKGRLYGLTAYYVSPQGAHRLLKFAFPMEVQVDSYTEYAMHEAGARIFLTERSLVPQVNVSGTRVQVKGVSESDKRVVAQALTASGMDTSEIVLITLGALILAMI
ncbi:Uncharacterized protein SCF082_LOCUS21109 [Durusdinium trenchii]|uniref:Glycosyl transferase family 25 domain-containing protein n=1 Tax=Durusdinium trenchii TaxID=1381693 RepID=A0ABP0L9S7_9DINO